MLQELLTQIDVLRVKIDEAWEILKLDAIREEMMVLEGAQVSPDFWSDPERAKKQSQRLAEIKKDYDVWNGLRMGVLELDELVHIAMEDEDMSLAGDIELRLAALEKDYIEREFALLFSGDHDDKNAIVAVHAGAGGTDAQDWAEMLLRMYFRYAERKEWSVQLVDESRGGEAGIKSATFIVSGRHAYGHLKAEAGVHRLVRQSPFNSDALRQTSFEIGRAHV